MTISLGHSAMPSSLSTKKTAGGEALLYVAFGSNLGNREEHIARAAEMLGKRIGRLVSMSDMYETKPEGFRSDNLFLNAAAAYTTRMKAAEILRISQELERELGRRCKSRNGAYHDRTIDIDLLWKSDETADTEELTLPHPRMKERLFVMEPLAEIAPTLLIGGENICHLAETMKKGMP